MNRAVIPQESVMASWQKTRFLGKEKQVETRGWTLDIMNCIDRLDKKEFSLTEVYTFEDELQQSHPQNKHVKDKIRQQLQILRDNEYLKFLGQGRYRIQ